jgi:hypothetical protein
MNGRSRQSKARVEHVVAILQPTDQCGFAVTTVGYLDVGRLPAGIFCRIADLDGLWAIGVVIRADGENPDQVRILVTGEKVDGPGLGIRGPVSMENGRRDL